MNQQNPAYLLLADGTFFLGLAFGYKGTTTGEICFNTGMTGYQEVFTDPSYYGQVLIMNAAHIGNYGAANADVESNGVKISGLICKNLSERYSRTKADQDLEAYLIENKIVAIHGVDTRALVAHVRKNGAMNCIISTEISDEHVLKAQLEKVPDMAGLELSSHVTTQQSYELGNPEAQYRIAVYDFGVKNSILQNMVTRGAYLKVFPAKTPFSETLDFNPQAYFISNGPGDPASMDYAIETVKKIVESGKPTFGICLGHQLICLSQGASSYKMHHGHRGLNHPVLNLKTQQSEISTQNHGFAVNIDSVKSCGNIEITHINLNDDTLEGVRIKDKPVFSVQYHPEATPGPHDSRYLFDDFMRLIEESS